MPSKFHLIILFVLSITISACGDNSNSTTQNKNTNGLTNNNTTALTDSESVSDKIKGGFSVVVLGSGGPAAMPVGRASSGYLIMIENKPRILLDAGGGTYQRLAETGINIKDIEIILMTHLHVDHTADIPAMIKTAFFHARAAGMLREEPFKFFGPATTTASPAVPYPSSTDFLDGIYGASGVYRYLNGFTGAIQAGSFNRSVTDLPFSFKLSANADPTDPNPLERHEIYNDGMGLVIESIGVKHANVPAVAYRISYGGKSIVYSGDTNSETANMATIAENTDILFYDTAIMDSVPDCSITPAFCALHTKPVRIGEIAAMANPRLLVLTHLTGFTLPNLDEIEDIVKDQGYEGKIDIASDLKVYNLIEDD